MYVADTFNHRVVILSRDLEYVHRFGRIGSGFAEFSYPVGVAVWRQWLVVADEYNQRLQLWRLTTEEGTVSATCLAEAFCANVLRSPLASRSTPSATCSSRIEGRAQCGRWISSRR